MTTYSESASELFEMAMQNLERGDYHLALSNLSLSLQCEERAETHFERAKLYYKIDNIEAALRDVDLAIDLLQSQIHDVIEHDTLGKEILLLREELLPILNEMNTRKEEVSRLIGSKDLDGLLEHFDLAEFREDILSLSQPAVRIRLAGSNPGVRSRFGGLPDLPEGFPWPSKGEKYLDFLAQIDLSELSETFASSLIGEQGILSFFYDVDDQPWGFDPKDRSGWEVLYFPESANCIQTVCPVERPDHCKFEECALTFEEELTFIDPCVVDSDYYSEYCDFCKAWNGIQSRHQLFGYPQLIQNDWRIECQLASNGLNVGDPSGYKSERAQELEGGADNWRLLLQIDSDELTGMQWGDVGRLYFCIEEERLSQRDFSNVWTVLQCY